MFSPSQRASRSRMCRVSWNRRSACCYLSVATATTVIYTLSLHDALPISDEAPRAELLRLAETVAPQLRGRVERSEEHTSELQSRFELVCRLLLEKKKARRSSAHRRASSAPATRGNALPIAWGSGAAPQHR